ncbi:hypothetical protein GLW03_02470 [Halobacillus halophilus]|uniref:hypothetical protein n=1 Tax=Halobacillus halophilus TaxID=1570 RepID=UPI00136908F5|nr:hypothetical protein [Halobacillus halophilus]MYL28675.1 hypothetical protein [Halobacillus halophilus]
MNKHMERTSRWLKRNARPLEAARWEALFEKGSKAKVLEYLKAFQNEDGGFGHGVEPDFQLPDSSPMAAWAASQVLTELNVSSKEPLLQQMVSYLLRTYDHHSGMWPSVIPEVNQYPHAPWWTWREGVQTNWMFNPGAEIAGFLIDCSQANTEAWSTGVESAGKALQHLMNAHEMDFHEWQCYQNLWISLNRNAEQVQDHLPYSIQRVQAHLLSLGEECLIMDPSEWGNGYGALPTDIISSPQHPLYSQYKPLVLENLRYFLRTLKEEGVWDISWDWGGGSKAFAIAEQQWKGITAVHRWKKINAFQEEW